MYCVSAMTLRGYAPKIRLGLFVTALVLVNARTTHAQNRDAAAAEVLFRKAKEAVKTGDYKTACPLFYESQRLDPGIGTILNLANCEEKLGNFATALGRYQEARGLMAGGDDRIGYAEAQVAALVPRAPMVTIRLRGTVPAGLEIQRDEVVLSKAALNYALPVDPGSHVYLVRAPGLIERKYEVTLREGESRQLDIDVSELAPIIATPVAVDQKDTPAGPPTSGRGNQIAGVTLGSIGALSLATGTVTGLMAISDFNTYKRECPTLAQCSTLGRDAQRRGRVLAVISPVTLGVGVVGLGLAAYFLFFGPKEGKRASHVQVMPWLSSSGQGFTLQAPF
jgi:hypothetical protein